MTSFTTTLLATCMTLMFSSGAEQKAVPFGYAHVQTVKSGREVGAAQTMQPGIVVRFTPKHRSGETFTLSNRDGVALVPLRPGVYCFDAFDRKGNALRLEPTQATCFPIVKGETTEVGVVIRGE